MSGKKNNTKDVPTNIWEKNGIPELDYCSIERAAELLGCRINDLLCLAENKRIEICVKLQNFESSLLATSDLSSKKEWESFVSRNFSLFMMGDVATSKNGVSIFSPKIIHHHMIEEKKSKTEIKCFYDNNENIMTDVSHCSPIAYLSGLWAITFMRRESVDNLLNHKEINLTSLDFLLIEADYHEETSTLERFAFSPVTYYLYENGLLDESKLKPITTLTINDLYITKKQLNRIYDNKGNALPRIMTVEDENRSITNDIPEIKVTVHQVDMIKGLMRLLDFTDDEITNGTASELNTRLSEMAARKQVTCRTPDPKTWEKWRKKMN
ncbi:TPA: hypothetical protein SLN72_001389 [Morganella morganii]|nr:hypothetical protein [Morganella morganii]